MPETPLRRAATRDGLVALGVLAAWTVAVTLLARTDVWHPRWQDAHLWAGVGLAVPLALRRVAPAAGLWLTVVGYPLGYALLTYGSPVQADLHVLPLLVAAYAATRAGAVLPVLTGAAGAASTFALVVGADGVRSLTGPAPTVGDPSDTVLLLALVLAATALGTVAGRLAATTRSLELRNAELRALQAVRERAAVRAVRTRIARELHDVVAHHVSAIVVRAQAADRVGGDRPEEYREAVRWIAPAGKEALTAMRSVVRVLRAPDEGGAPLAPLPGLDDLAGVLDRVRGSGLAVDADLPDPLPPCPPEAGLALVRVVQEALTNVLVHSAATRAGVTLAARPGRLTLRVHDAGPARAGTGGPHGGGNGVVHMRERAAACGGTLTAGPGPDGWTVTMEVPVP
jgi:signal transduction histidine kinase